MARTRSSSPSHQPTSPAPRNVSARGTVHTKVTKPAIRPARLGRARLPTYAPDPAPDREVGVSFRPPPGWQTPIDDSGSVDGELPQDRVQQARVNLKVPTNTAVAKSLFREPVYKDDPIEDSDEAVTIEDDGTVTDLDPMAADMIDQVADYLRQLDPQTMQQLAARIFPNQGNGSTHGIAPQQPTRAPEDELITATRPVTQPVTHPLGVPAPAPVTARRVTIADIDRLWDWYRLDPAALVEAFAITPKHSRDLFTLAERFVASEQAGHALLRSIDYQDAHIGFVFLLPITADRKGIVHIYLYPAARGMLAQLIGPLLDAAEREIPNVTLVIKSERLAQSRLLQDHGFTQTIFLTRPPRHPQPAR